VTAVWQMLGIVSVTIAATVFIRQYRPEMALVVSGMGTVLILLFVLGDLGAIVVELRRLLEEFAVDSAIFGVIIKSLGVCLIADFAGNTCRDFGHTALANGVEFAGKIVVVALSLPIIGEIAAEAVELIK